MTKLDKAIKEKEKIQQEINELSQKLAAIEEEIETLQNVVESSGNIIKDISLIVDNEWENDKSKKKVTDLFLTPLLDGVFEDDYKLTTYVRGETFEISYYEQWMEDLFKGIAFYVVPSNEDYMVFLLLVCETPISDKQREQIRNFKVLKDIKYKSDEYDSIDNTYVRERIVFMTRYRTKYNYSNERIIEDYLTIQHFAQKQASDRIVTLKELSNISKKQDNHEHNLVKKTIKIPVVLKGGNKSETKPITAYYCKRCDCYFLSDNVLAEYKKQGIVLFSKDPFRKLSGDSYNNDLEAQSLLNICGYNVNASTNYTSKQRQAILIGIVENKILSCERIMDYLSYFVRRSKNQQKMKQANEKWSEDLRFMHMRYKKKKKK